MENCEAVFTNEDHSKLKKYYSRAVPITRKTYYSKLFSYFLYVHNKQINEFLNLINSCEYHW